MLIRENKLAMWLLLLALLLDAALASSDVPVTQNAVPHHEEEKIVFEGVAFDGQNATTADEVDDSGRARRKRDPTEDLTGYDGDDGGVVTYNETAFNLLLFENFGLTQKVFASELKLIGLLKRLRDTLKDLSKGTGDQEASFLETRSIKSAVTNLTDFHNNFTHPMDYVGARRGIVLLQDTYQFDLTALTKGKLVSKLYPKGPIAFKNEHPVGLDDLMQFTNQAFSVKWYDRAIDFLRAAFKLLEKTPKSRWPAEAEVARMRKMRHHLFQLNNHQLYTERSAVTKSAKVHMYVVTEKLGRKKEQPDFIRSGQILGMSNATAMGQDAYFRAVCNGFNLRSMLGLPPRDGGAPPPRCRLLHHHNPLLRLAPLKLEVVSESPYIVIFQEFFHQSEIDFLIDHSTPQLSRTRMIDSYNDGVIKQREEWAKLKKELKTDEEKKQALKGMKKKSKIVHKSVQVWIEDLRYRTYYDNLHEVEEDDSYDVLLPNLLKLSRRLEAAAGVNITAKYASTMYQTTNYGLGGLCAIHNDPGGYIEGVEIPDTDPAFQRLVKQGDMIATFMGWLNGVPAGGATAFVRPYHETIVWPTKGSVAFWWDLDKKGHRDSRTQHGGCPIISGSKWILNKWVYYYDQFQNYPCSLDPEEMQHPFTSHY